MVRTQYSGQRMMIPQRMTEEQKRQLMESQQQKVRLQGHPGMVFQTAQPPTQSGPGAQAPPPYLQQHLANPNLAGAGMEGGGNMMNPGMMNQPPPHQFLHRPVISVLDFYL